MATRDFRVVRCEVVGNIRDKRDKLPTTAGRVTIEDDLPKVMVACTSTHRQQGSIAGGLTDDRDSVGERRREI